MLLECVTLFDLIVTDGAPFFLAVLPAIKLVDVEVV